MFAWPALFAFTRFEEGAKLAFGTMTRLLVRLTLAVLLAIALAGCGGGDKEKGINANKDRPKAADKGE